ncbi:MAG: hypothetical protein SPL10_05595 [Synergistales bacterium]|nr:hypothetical protein [Synergistales bacterium]MDY6400826.1 hypothetical protein [Synergistales bacterium]MDY6405466.1 hypothetical protein [Synergistales bacterium]MDY6410481.1 hypothetical protein [Synergistales bacterium]MDY6414619.1 hypothetical protein [Synergistales bacterium]
MKNIKLLRCAVFTLFVFIFMFTVSVSRTFAASTNSQPSASEEVIEVTAAEVFRQYKENHDAFAKMISRKRVRVSGIVTDKINFAGTRTVVVGLSDSLQSSADMAFVMRWADNDNVAKLQRGQKATIEGVCSSFSYGAIAFQGCRVIPPAKQKARRKK